MGDTTFNRIRSIIATGLEIAPSNVMPATSFIDDLHADSLDMIELIMAFENAFDVMIPDIAVETIVTVQDAVVYIEQQQPRRSGGDQRKFGVRRPERYFRVCYLTRGGAWLGL